MTEPPGDPRALGGLGPDDLADAMRPLWEDAGPLVAALVGVDAPSWDAHIDAAEAAIAGMDPATRAELLLAHPRIGARPAELAARSAASYREQGGDAPVDPATGAGRLDELNDRYEARFGFPFVEWVAGRPRAALVPVLTARLARDRETELDAGCAALVAIARDRLVHLRSAR